MSEEKQKNRRRAYRSLFQSQLQMKYGLYYVGIGAVTVVIANVLLFFMMLNLVEMGNSMSPGTSVGKIVYFTVLENAWPLALGATLICFVLLSFALLMSQKIVGPTVALNRHIQALQEGDYNHKTKLRKGDEFVSLQESLNELSDILKQRHS